MTILLPCPPHQSSFPFILTITCYFACPARKISLFLCFYVLKVPPKCAIIYILLPMKILNYLLPQPTQIVTPRNIFAVIGNNSFLSPFHLTFRQRWVYEVIATVLFAASSGCFFSNKVNDGVRIFECPDISNPSYDTFSSDSFTLKFCTFMNHSVFF